MTDDPMQRARERRLWPDYQPNLADPADLAKWIEHVRSAAFLGGARGEEISKVEAQALSSLLTHQDDGWRPIETAPRDGTPILAYRPDDTFSPETGMDVLWWDAGGWLYDGAPVWNQPTHWRPLPPAPEMGR